MTELFQDKYTDRLGAMTFEEWRSGLPTPIVAWSPSSALSRGGDRRPA
jgi:hypothetical protein